ncbi:MAG: UDP-N-acetylmuramate dehydrogenase [Candidatus Pacebacteria bacterium]|nr:UDP-N-acetylmuramate dehydrogenase [Candidatus Paceibacterota bacterium]MBT6756123.1 UDP-N-acetylmuramate dehydrogenase [Candidatus Paceibacterota bacterium]MBT6921357.1 UDP-N-acetylmuramate dehydrogenase [Candidatus Paceibacterota bacterium]
MTKLQQQLKSSFPDYFFEFDVSMSKKTYFRIGGPAEVFIELDKKQQVQSLVKWCKDNNEKFIFFGGGSNVIVSDRGISGVVIKLTNSEIEFEKKELDSLEKANITIGAGTKMPLAVKKTIDEGYTGLEYFLGVPGTIGGAIYNNAHYLEDLIGKHVSRVEILNKDGEFQWLSHDECQFAYDYSRFQKTKEIIFRVEFSLVKGDKEKSMALVRKATEYRAKTQPLALPSSGCIFQNVPNNPKLREQFPLFAERQHVPGGFLIDQAGLKGEHEGGIEVSDKHAAFFVNTGQGTAAEVKKLIFRVKSAVKNKFQVELNEEVFWLE